jgi:hypothetical protein
MKLAWGNKVDSAFILTLLHICKRLGWGPDHPSWLMACMAFETAETFDPSIKNAAGSGATGLIQFMPRTANGLGTSVDALEVMTAPQQLLWVEKYFQPYAKRIKSLPDMYMAILAPKAIGKSNDFALYSSGAAYRMNSGLDANSDGKITKLEASRFVMSKLEKGMGFGMWSMVEDSESVIDIVDRLQTDLLLLRASIEG